MARTLPARCRRRARLAAERGQPPGRTRRQEDAGKKTPAPEDPTSVATARRLRPWPISGTEDRASARLQNQRRSCWRKRRLGIGDNLLCITTGNAPTRQIRHCGQFRSYRALKWTR